VVPGAPVALVALVAPAVEVVVVVAALIRSSQKWRIFLRLFTGRSSSG